MANVRWRKKALDDLDRLDQWREGDLNLPPIGPAIQINGCAYCLSMHTQDARRAGETEQRLYCLSAWRECTFYTERERAALALTEAVTLISQQGVCDALYNQVRAQFSEKEFLDLVLLINQINSWNRLSIAMGSTNLAGPHGHIPR